MLMIRFGQRATNAGETTCMYRARTRRSTFPSRSSSIRASAWSRCSFEFGTWAKGTPKDSTEPRRSAWFDTTSATSARRSPRFQVQSSSRSAWSCFDTSTAIFLRSEERVSRQSIANGRATSRAKACFRSSRGRSSLPVWNSRRVKYTPPWSSEVCWSKSVMFAPWR